MGRIDETGTAIGSGVDREAGGQPGRVGRGIVENIMTLTASPLRVWSVLTDFASHRRWKPYIRLAGEPVEGGEVTYTFRIGGLDKPFSTKAVIIRVEKPVAFVWTTGVAGLLLFEEAYELSRDPIGTRLRHSLKLSGILAGMWTVLLRRRLLGSLVTSDRCLERHLRRPTSQAKGRPLPLSPGDGIGRNRKKS